MQHSTKPLLAMCFLLGASWALAQGKPAGQAHLDSARAHAKGQPPLVAAMAKWCSTAEGSTAAIPLQERTLRLLSVEAAYQRERQAERPDTARLRSLVVERECAAFQETRSPGGAERPVWLLSQLRVLRPSPAHADDLYVRATATNLAGPVVGSRITFSRGLHMSCFGTTDTRGQVQCKLLDTHPHGPGSEGTHQEHAGPLVVTLAGTADSHRIQLPAVVIQTEKGHKAAKNH